MSDKHMLLLRWLLITCLPLVVVLTNARVLVTPWYPAYEYAKASLPPDPYGFTLAQRLDLARVAVDYLNTPGAPAQHIDMLEEQRMPGMTTPLYTAQEISHMIEVKTFTDLLWRVYGIAALLVGGSVVALLARQSTRATAMSALRACGPVTVGSLGALLIFVLTGWSLFFNEFHEVFFPPGTWTFDYGSSLIRLFPEKLRFDGGVLLVGSALAVGLAAAALGHLLYRRAAACSGYVEAR